MSLVSVKDFGDALGISGGTIRSKISRGQLLRNKNKLIDTEDPTNYIYLLEVNGGEQSCFDKFHKAIIVKPKIDKKTTSARKTLRLDKNEVKTTVISSKSKKDNPNDSKALVTSNNTVETNKKEAKIIPQKLTIEEKRALSDARVARETLLSYEIRKKEADVKLVERSAEIKEIQLEKLAGNTLPLDITKTILKVNIQSIFKTFSAELENIATISVEILGGSRNDLVRISNEQNIMLKKLVEIAKNNSEAEIERVVAEYSEVRSRGERK